MPYLVKCLLEVNKDMVEIFLVLQERILRLKICSVVLDSKAGLFFSDDVFCLWLGSVKDDLQHDFTWVADGAYCPVVLTQL